MRQLLYSISVLLNRRFLTFSVSAYTLAAQHTLREMRNALAELFLITAALFLFAVIITLYKLLSRSRRIKTSLVVFIYLAAILVLITTLICTYIYCHASGLPLLFHFLNPCL